MWPWEHLAVAYLLYSARSRWLWGRPPTTRGTLVVAFASQLPDLVDKPLAWLLFVLPGGRTLGHSLFVGLPLVGVAFVVGWVLDSYRGSIAFAVGLLSHLAGTSSTRSSSAATSAWASSSGRSYRRMAGQSERSHTSANSS